MKIKLLIDLFTEDDSMESLVQMVQLVDLITIPNEKVNIRLSPKLDSERDKKNYRNLANKINNIVPIYRVDSVYLSFPSDEIYDAEVVCEPLFEEGREQIKYLIDYLKFFGFKESDGSRGS